MTPQEIMNQNAAASNFILRNCNPVIQKTYSYNQTSNPYVSGLPTTINVPIINTGLIKRLWVEITANVQQGAAENQILQSMGGPSNFLSNITIYDLQNLVRINTTGWHLAMLAAARRQFPLGASITSDTPIGIGSNYGIVSAPAVVTGAANISMVYEVPLAYSDHDTRGAIFANVVNATMNMQLTLNPNMFVAAGANGVQAMYKSSTAQLGKLNSYTINIYQEYWDQIPKDPATGQYILPLLNLAQSYNILSSNNTGLAVGSDQSLPYAPFRTYMSTFIVYDNGGVVNAGTDINYFSLATANTMNLFKYPPKMAQLINGRAKINADWPIGAYYFDHRAMPISTMTYGNMAMNVNPSVVNANAQLLLGYEFFSSPTQMQAMGSIQSN